MVGTYFQFQTIFVRLGFFTNILYRIIWETAHDYEPFYKVFGINFIPKPKGPKNQRLLKQISQYHFSLGAGGS